MNVLTIQSHVVYGRVGNDAATLPLQRLGHEAWRIDTVRFSNHPGHGGFRGVATEPGEIADLVQGLDDCGLLRRCDAVLSGYVGAPGAAFAIAEAVARVKAANPAAVYCCDPVIGDDGGVFVRPGVAEAIADACVPAADIVTPNAFEAAHLTGIVPDTFEAARAAAAALAARGPRTVVLTSLRRRDRATGTIETLAHEAAGTWCAATPEIALPGRPDGAGDLFAALFLGRWLASRDAGAALAAATASVYGILARTAASGSRELEIVAAQEEIVAPTHDVEATRIG
ncbi:MAG: pyridoxal kinase PdxY [Rhodospirillales bacterium]